jgi:hypothetical protein
LTTTESAAIFICIQRGPSPLRDRPSSASKLRPRKYLVASLVRFHPQMILSELLYHYLVQQDHFDRSLTRHILRR